MDYKNLGRSGLKVSRLCLGTMNFGPFTTQEDSFAIMDKALEVGVNFFDTANAYGRHRGRGVTEEIIGRWLAQGGRRQKVVLATKVYGMMGDGVNERRLSAYHIRQACEDSLRRLQTDHIDLYQMHHIDRETPWEEIWQAMENLVRDGKVIYVGSSNFAGWHIAQAQEAAKARHFMGLVCEQSLYNLKDRMIELEVIPACREYGLGLIPWSPLAGGLLGGALAKEAAKKTLPQAAESDNLRKRLIVKIEAAIGATLNRDQLAQARVVVQGVYDGVLKEEKILLSVAERQRLFELIVDEMLGMDARREAEHIQKEFEKRRPQLEQYENLCRELGEKPADVALAWLLHNPVVTAPIIGPRTMDQFTGSLRSAEIKLSPDVMKKLDEIFPSPGGEAPEVYAW